MLSYSTDSGAQELLDPGWNDPFFTRYVDARADVGAAAEPGDGVAFSLPVLGFRAVEPPDPTVEAAFAAEPARPLSAAVASWPECAAEEPAVITIPETPDQSAGLPPGSWYVRSLDFGCVEIGIEGSRVAVSDAFAASDTPAGESGTVEVIYQDENAGEHVAEGPVDADAAAATAPEPEEGGVGRGSPTISLVRGNLIYSMTVNCIAPESYALCADERSLTALAGELTTVGGAP